MGMKVEGSMLALKRSPLKTGRNAAHIACLHGCMQGDRIKIGEGKYAY